MRLATLRIDGGTLAVRVDPEHSSAVAIEGVADVGALLAAGPDWRERALAADGPRIPLDSLGTTAWAPVVPRPSKIVCVGLNYRDHILEMGRELPAYPTLFAKFAEALIGAGDDIRVPAHSAEALDWEGELAVVVGRAVRDVDPATAASAIAGYSVLNDVTMRDRQYRTTQWLQGKTLEGSCPFGPVLVTADEFTPGAALTTSIDGETVQHAATDDLVFGPAELVSYISSIVTLQPGDVIATGTPGGVGHAMPTPRHLAHGETVRVEIAGIGAVGNRVVVLDGGH
ncbi:fumarylacetoacetate hydrolase family protein [Herbiconiux moechotypicola]|uniref:Fumarylacetoacetate hydrolase family protein n=1 Tax=Herbiconiux moechotypicola TaxID=637393 RepID=A0ABP5Q6Z2_9MICO|nr:fumarylacetoacetate hydrolase family protein [Herbiconiux moechotypicola]MCS5728685.1 fumarylacetoacetate hydrolase family protein [Herbiconiux moechotypicola]